MEQLRRFLSLQGSGGPRGLHKGVCPLQSRRGRVDEVSWRSLGSPDQKPGLQVGVPG